MRPIARREVLLWSPAAGLALLGLSRAAVARAQPGAAVASPAGAPPATSAAATGAWPGFPRFDPALVQAVVGASHGNEERVRELVDKHPSLANATIDWGFGDWETAIGAASHTGRRSIAEYLISRGARVDLFAATMLGWLDVVKGMLAASPGIQRTLGPHSLTLLHHAKAGGDQAKPVLQFLEGIGGADEGPKPVPLGAADRAAVEGEYSYGPGPGDRFAFRSNKEFLEFTKEGASARRLGHLGDREFYPAGAGAVKIRFEAGAPSPKVAIVDHDLVVTATRV